MQLLSVNVGVPQLVMRNDEPVSTAIFKKAVATPIMLRTLNLDGDRQADLSVHGGPTKAVYLYPSEHYDYWRQEYPDMDLPYGMFGENFTTSGFLESEVCIGDEFRVGSARVRVTEPRMPCYKLGIRFGRTDIIKKFLVSQRTGFYFAVLQEGEVNVGDEFQLSAKSKSDVRVSDITRLYVGDKQNVELLRRAIAAEALPEGWRTYFQDRLERLTVS
jgi:MOSC domain-containing protein YiiM